MHASRRFHQAVLYPSAAFAILFNCLLAAVVLHPSQRSIGAYRGLLVAFACSDVVVAVVHAFVLPVYVQVEYGAVLFLWDTLEYPFYVALALTLITICLFYISFPLLTCHFIYRYFAAVGSDFISRHLRVAILAAISITASFTGVIMYAVWTLQTNVADSFFDVVLLVEYGIDLRKTDAPPVILMNYLHTSGEWNWTSLRAIAYVGSALMLTLAVNSACVWRIVHNLRTNVQLSAQTRHLQLQMFRSLIVQFAVPFIFCVFPFAFITLPPSLGLSFGDSAVINFIGMLVPMYPSVDPLLVIMSFPRFRRTLAGWYGVAPVSADPTTNNSSSHANPS